MTDQQSGLPSWDYVSVIDAHVMQVIRVEHTKGEGNAESPVRRAFAYFTVDGEKLWEDDPHA